MLTQHFDLANDVELLPVGRNGQDYLTWIEEIAQTPDMAGALVVSFSRYLHAVGYTGNPDKPDHTDPREIYLAKAARAFLCDQLDYEFQNIEFTPEETLRSWLFSQAGRIWLINDSTTNTMSMTISGSCSAPAKNLQNQMAYLQPRSI